MPSRNQQLASIVIIVAIAIPLLGWWRSSQFAPLEPRKGSEVPGTGGLPPGYRDQLRATFAPILLRAAEKNEESQARCVERVREHFRRYREQIPAFVDDVTSLGTRLSVLKLMPGDWWFENDAVEEFMNQKFSEHFFAEEQLHEILHQDLTALREELQANRATLLANIRLSITEQKFPGVQVPDGHAFDQYVEKELVAMATQGARDSVQSGLTSLVASEVGGMIATSLVTRAVSSLSASAATTSVASGGAVASATSAGAGGGSMAGPVGTAIGLGVGVAIGVAIDWWMTTEFREKLHNEMERYLFNLEHEILFGKPDQPGLEVSLETLIENLNQVEEKVVLAF